jgi:hypothetical protein
MSDGVVFVSAIFEYSPIFTAAGICATFFNMSTRTWARRNVAERYLTHLDKFS